MEQLFNIPKMYTSILLVSLHYAKVPKGWSYPAHKHAMFEFLYCASGRMEQWVNGQPYALREGDALLIKSNLPHHTATQTEDAEYLVFHFDVDVPELQAVFQIVPDLLIPAREAEEEDRSLSVARWVKEFLEEWKDPLVLHTRPRAPGADGHPAERSVKLLRMQMRILDLICMLAERFTREAEVALHADLTPAQRQLAREVAARLELHAGDRLRIDELAKETGFHRSYISDCFKKVYGVSPRDYVTKLKIRSAKQLLRNTDLTVSNIAERLGFSSPAHFSAFFANNVGEPPLKYRKRQSP
ncbi:AraC family transcriptional regulator [Paenibacillus sp.]|uniref:helix-turn-helix domain-containing protein n=1 Tax=Paenibacillus sp. TaxID=58172 RepID=UPI002D574777|nr:AraC family transcriptional regulator [Paenibacillus sp.]HZG56208.1 AraC family transcriptional regulator [Paenibacillus sp.]